MTLNNELIPFLVLLSFKALRPGSNELLYQGVPSNNMIDMTPLVNLIKLCTIISSIYGIRRNAKEPRVNCAEVILMVNNDNQTKLGPLTLLRALW